jgi:hypothetical protein
MYPLLSYATNLQNPEVEVLIEEALKCWGVALAVEPAVAPQLVGLLGNMSHLLRRGKDNSAAFQILEAYLLLQVRFVVVLWEPAHNSGVCTFFGVVFLGGGGARC